MAISHDGTSLINVPVALIRKGDQKHTDINKVIDIVRN